MLELFLSYPVVLGAYYKDLVITNHLFVYFWKQEDSEDMDSLCRYLLHGNGHSCWFDKSFSGYVFKNGRVRAKW